MRLGLRLDRADRLDGSSDLLLQNEAGKAQTGRLVRLPAGPDTAAALRARRRRPPAGLCITRLARGNCV